MDARDGEMRIAKIWIPKGPYLKLGLVMTTINYAV
jgi:hypothetical protein